MKDVGFAIDGGPTTANVTKVLSLPVLCNPPGINENCEEG
jgi:hypothetical protein